MPDGADTTRDAVAAAFKEVSARAEPAPAPEPAPEPSPSPSTPAEPSGDAEARAEAKAAEDRARDGKGRFIVPKKPAAPEKAPASTTSAGQGGAVAPLAPVLAAAPPASPALEALKPPQDWRAQAKEKWAGLPREVQEEALRLHVETKKALQSRAELEKNWQGFTQATQPYEAMIRGAGFKTPAEAAEALLRREHLLSYAPPQARAQLLVEGIRNYLGTDEAAINYLSQAWQAMHDGRAQQPQQGPVDPRQIIAQAKQEFLNEIQQQQARVASNEAETSLSEFETSHEFMGDHEYAPRLRRIMAVLISDAAEERQHMSYEDAYKEALTMHPETKKIVGQREAAKAATAKAATTQAARAASSSLRNEPAGPANGTPSTDVRAEVAKNYYAQKNR